MGFASMNDAVDQDRMPQNFMAIGEVIDNEDPEHLDRIKCRIPHIYEEDMGELPWIFPKKHAIFGQGVGFGVYGVPKIGAYVFVEFQNGDENLPFYSSFAYGRFNRNPTFNSPDVYGFVDPSGNTLRVDLASMSWEFMHSSGAKVQINSENAVTLTCKTATVNCTDSTINSENSATVNTKVSTVKCTTSNVESQQFNVKANQTAFECPTNNFSGIINCAGLATGFGGGSGECTIAGDLKVEKDAEIGGIQFSTHVHSGVEPGGGNTGTPVGGA